jgi:hypothetical protein
MTNYEQIKYHEENVETLTKKISDGIKNNDREVLNLQKMLNIELEVLESLKRTNKLIRELLIFHCVNPTEYILMSVEYRNNNSLKEEKHFDFIHFDDEESLFNKLKNLKNYDFIYINQNGIGKILIEDIKKNTNIDLYEYRYNLEFISNSWIKLRNNIDNEEIYSTSKNIHKSIKNFDFKDCTISSGGCIKYDTEDMTLIALRDLNYLCGINKQ